ncbi:AAA family ATPase [Desulfovibrio desulfuricans]|uniref:AAA family ATPase n=1 Tax=Desulfovibrio desulfuricans TaxID=876 RepID=UPI001F2BB4C3|nr:AAA family ATPase [Desulfovibrio desulfuricans]UIA98870.1 AAA family ATPase [Desulfovibrio desulfuricans]
MYNRQFFSNFITYWCPMNVKTESGIPLEPKFSGQFFTKVFGVANATNIRGQDDEMLLTSFFEALLEQEASWQYHSNSESTVAKLLMINEWASISRNPLTVVGHLSNEGNLIWTANMLFPPAKGTSWTSLLKTIFNLSRLDALATLARILGMSFENIFQLSSDKHTAEMDGNRTFDDMVPNVLHLPGLPTGAACAELVDKTHIFGNAGQVIGAILRYRLKGNDFCIPATVGRGKLCIGKFKPTAHFLNQNIMDKNPYAPVIFCQDMRTALALQNMLNTTRGYTPDKVIVTAHLGNDLSVLPWNYLSGHDVIFASAPNQVCMAMIKQYKNHIIGAQAKSFRVHPGFLLHTPPDGDLKKTVESVSETEGELLNSAVIINDIERPSRLIQQVIKQAISYDEFMEWGQRLGIFKKPKAMSPEASAEQNLALPQADPALSPAKALKLEDVSLYHTMRPENYVLLAGMKGAGKTQVALSCCRAIIKGNVSWPLFSGTGIDAGNVAYIDAETPHDEYCANLEQHELASELGHRFFGISMFDPNLPEFCSAFSLTDSAFREGLTEYLLKHKCRFVFLDNLTALMGDTVAHGNWARVVLDWVKSLQKHGMCVVLVHHKSEDEEGKFHSTKIRGSHIFATLARTVIGLVSSTEVLNSDLGTKKVQVAAAQDGLTVGLRFDASKTAPVLEKKTFWLHLELGASDWDYIAATGADGKEIILPSSHNEAGNSSEPLPLESKQNSESFSERPQAILHALSPDERVILEILNTGSAKRQEIQNKSKFSADKTRLLLKNLTEMGMITREGQGKATYYVHKRTF